MERISQLVTIPNDKTACLQRCEQQLVGVQGNRVGPAATKEAILHLITEDKQCPICAATVEPQALTRAQTGDVIDRVNYAGVHGASRRHYTERSRSRAAIL